MPPGTLAIQVAVPTDALLRRTIDLWAEYVVTDGHAIESLLLGRVGGGGGGGGGDADLHGVEATPLSFLLEPPDSDAGRYYRWRVFSLLMGDSRSAWRTAPFRMSAGGEWWMPPPLPQDADADGGDIYDDDAVAAVADRAAGAHGRGRRRSRSGSRSRSRSPPGGGGGGSGAALAEREKARGARRGRGLLREGELAEWKGVLAGLTLSRGSVRDAMAFALGHADCAGDVVDQLVAALCLGTPYGAPPSPSAEMPPPALQVVEINAPVILHKP
jgi:hypothetical protein